MARFEHCRSERMGADDPLVADAHAGADSPQVRHPAGTPLNVGADHFHFSYPAARVSPCDEALGEPDHQRPSRDELANLVIESTSSAFLSILATGGGKSNLSALVRAFLAVLGKNANVGADAKDKLHFLVSELTKLKGTAFAKRVDTIHGVAANEVKVSDPDLFRAYSNLRTEALKNK